MMIVNVRQKMKYVIIFSLLFWLLIGLAIAEPKTGGGLFAKYKFKVDALYVSNPYMSKKVAARATREAIKKANQLQHIRASRGKRYDTKDPFHGARSFTNKEGGFYMAQTFFNSHVQDWKRKIEKPNILIITDPPVEIDGSNYQGGYAAPEQRIAYCNGMEVNDKGLPRYRSLVVCLAHEIAHIFCASHDQTNKNIMHENALAEYEAVRVSSGAISLPFNQKAQDEVKRCVLGLINSL